VTPDASCELIREKAKSGVARAAGLKPYRLKNPVELELRFKNYRPAEVLAYLPNVERADSHTVRFRGKDVLEVARFIEFVLHYEPGLAP
jgi:D-amino peptidase